MNKITWLSYAANLEAARKHLREVDFENLYNEHHWNTDL